MTGIRRSLARGLIAGQVWRVAAVAALVTAADGLAQAVVLHDEANAELQAGKFAVAAERFAVAGRPGLTWRF